MLSDSRGEEWGGISHFLVAHVQMRDYFNEVQVMRAFNSGTLRGKAFPLSWKQPKQNWLIPDTEMVCESHREPLPGFGAWPGVGVIPLATFRGEVGGGGLKLPFFDVVSTGRVFLSFSGSLCPLSVQEFPPTLVFWRQKGRGWQGRRGAKRTPLKLNIVFRGNENLAFCSGHYPPAKLQQQGCWDKRTPSKRATK